MKRPHVSRRDFLQVAAFSLGAAGFPAFAAAKAGGRSVSLVADPADSLTTAPPVRWAIHELGLALAAHGITLRTFESIRKAPRPDFCIVAAGRDDPLAAPALKNVGVTVPGSVESLALASVKYEGRRALLACGGDVRGLMYALLEIADRVRHSSSPMEALTLPESTVEQPFNATRSIGRLFVSDVEDKPWFYDREMWPAYFAMLAAHRFNRFHLSFGLGYDFLRNVTDAYFLFVYPFFLSVPGYNVRAAKLPDAERDRNLEMLRFISSQAVGHGIDFQLGIWTHGYQWADSPRANYTIEGLTPETHAAYSRDALAALLQACPAISGVTLRTHGESGVREGSYAFWKTVFDGVAKSGRKIEIDLHTKGLNQKIIDDALSTGMPLRLSPKYWAEHMGMPYHQAAIRELEMPQENEHPESSFFALSSGSRSFTRYGYADFLREGRPYKVMIRIWPGTHRLLLWGNPAMAAAHAHAFQFCGCDGAELFEPLSFKGREGSGLPGGRCAYADASLTPHWDWQKFLYTYRVWGRLIYNPESDSDVWQRSLRREFPEQPSAVDAALASASCILPIVTTAHSPSAANVNFEPEMYTNQSMLDPGKWYPYNDTSAPRVFANVSPLDPQLFSRMSDFAAELLKRERSGKYSPVEVAQWLEDLAQTAAENLVKAATGSSRGSSPQFRRLAADVKIQIGLGRFYAAKFRSGTLYALHEQSGDRTALEEALKLYRRARGVWSQFAEEAKGVYVADITVGPEPFMRGNWLDRLHAMDADIAEMAERLASSSQSPESSPAVRSAIHEILGRPQRFYLPCKHSPAGGFVPGKPVELALSISGASEGVTTRVYYRHVDQAERYQTVEMQAQGWQYHAMIPADYVGSTYPLQYYFELKQGPEKAWLYPGLTPDRRGVPYFVLSPRA
jgi:hypothetical protein